MDPAYVVLLIIVAAAIAVIAGYLIAITLVLRHVVNRLVTILGAVDAVTETSQPVGAIIDDLNRDLDAGRQIIEDAVQRLESGRVPVGATAEAPPSRHPTEGDAWDSWDRGDNSDRGDTPGPPAPPTAGPPAGNTEDEPREARRGFWNRT